MCEAALASVGRLGGGEAPPWAACRCLGFCSSLPGGKRQTAKRAGSSMGGACHTGRLGS